MTKLISVPSVDRRNTTQVVLLKPEDEAGYLEAVGAYWSAAGKEDQEEANCTGDRMEADGKILQFRADAVYELANREKDKASYSPEVRSALAFVARYIRQVSI